VSPRVLFSVVYERMLTHSTRTAPEIISDSAASSSSRASGSTSESPHRPQDEEALRRVLKLPLGTVAQMGKLIGGTVSLQRLMAIGEVAKVRSSLSLTKFPSPFES